MSSARGGNPFDDDDDFGSFGNRGSAARSNYSRDDGDELKRLQERIGQTENDSVESTQRALRALNEAKETGSKTAEELVRQGEQLNNIDEKLDDVDQTLTATQKNINQVKSIFGGLKNRFMRSSSSSNSISKQAPPKSVSTSKSKSNFNESSQQSKPKFTETITGSDREKEINRNLDDMSSGLSELNSLALNMKFELERQNPMIERITEKSERTHNRIEHQDKQMKQIR